MSDKTGIEWTDATWNPVTGCAKVSAGCKHCYALREWTRLSANPKTVYYGRQFTDVRCHPERLDQPFRMTKPRMIFVNSMSDLFHEDVPDEFIDQVFAAMARARQHTYQVLTKRADRMARYMNTPDRKNRILAASHDLGWAGMMDMPWPIPHVWVGVSVENQETAEQRIPLLLQAQAAVRWISAEPLLGPVDLSYWLDIYQYEEGDIWRPRNLSRPINSPDWVVVGGESGPKARPMHPDWAYALQAQCEGADVPFLFKQWGEWVSAGQPAFGTVKGEVRHIRSDGNFWGDDLPQDENADVLTVVKVGKKAAGRLLGGRQHDGYPGVDV